MKINQIVEGINPIKRAVKGMKRRLQGWDKNLEGPGGEKLGDPKEIVKRNKTYSDDTTLQLAKRKELGFPFGGDSTTGEHTPRGLQRKVLDREIKKRGIGEQGVAEGRFGGRDAYERDYDSSVDMGGRNKEWDEGNTEPPNNFAIYINGKKWKVFPGEGTYAEDFREQRQHQRLKELCAKKTATTGKKWSVSPTGEAPTP
jgi:hypothetical protein